MAVLDDTLKNYIDCNEYYHHLFTNVKENQIQLIKKEIGISPFLDIVLEFDDYYKIIELLNTIPDSDNKRMIEESIIRDYLYFKIIESVNLEDYEIEDIRKKLYSGSFEKYKTIHTTPLIWNFIDDELKDLASKTNKNKARCHFFIDSVKDTKLQYEINSLYASTTSTVLMGYTTKESLITYSSSFGDFIEDPHDYQTHNLKK